MVLTICFLWFSAGVLWVFYRFSLGFHGFSVCFLLWACLFIFIMVFDPPNQKETHLANEAHLACVFFFKFKPHQKVASKGYIEAKKTKLFQACLKNKKNTWFGV